MSISLYDISIPVFTLSLNNLSAILDKAESHRESKKVDPKVIPQARLIVDMLPLSAQIQIACDTAKGAAARLAGVEVPKHEDTEATLAELKARVSKTLDFIKTIKPEQLQGAETREVWNGRLLSTEDQTNTEADLDRRTTQPRPSLAVGLHPRVTHARESWVLGVCNTDGRRIGTARRRKQS